MKSNRFGYHTIGRRQFLRAAGALVALPSMESLAAPIAKAASSTTKAKNLVSIGAYLGWHQNAFYPKEVGRGYTMPTTLSPLADHQDNFTVFSGDMICVEKIGFI